MPQGLPRKIRYAFVTQGLLAGLVVVAGVGLGALFTRDALVGHQLDTEAGAFWQQLAAAPAAPPVPPASHALQGYHVPPGADVPDELRSLPDGISHRYRQGRAVLVSRTPEGSLYLVARTASVDRVLACSAAGLIGLGLLAVLLITWLTYRKSRSIVLPINRLAEAVERWDPAHGEAAAPAAISGMQDRSREVRALSAALRGLVGRVAEFVQRERDFTRDASHELRTPLTVIRVASDMMLADPATPPHSLRSLSRIQRAGRDMEAVIDAFLILAREGGVAPVSEEFEVRDVVLDEVDKVRPQLAGRPVELRVVENAAPRLFAPPRVLGVVLGNLLDNACTFTEAGHIEVVVDADAVTVRDTGIGMSDETLEHAFEPFFRADSFSPVGKGFGLSIAGRLARRFGWPLSLESVPGQGTIATVRFVPLMAAADPGMDAG